MYLHPFDVLSSLVLVLGSETFDFTRNPKPPFLGTVHANVKCCVSGESKLIASLVRSQGSSECFVGSFWT